MISNFELWSSAHVNQSTSIKMLDFTQGGFGSDIDWFKYQVDNTPNGKLLVRNAMFDSLRKEKVYLAHITTRLPSIASTKKILSSSGCLIGSLYCVPVLMDSGGMRLHNLGQYIYTKEAPAFKNQNDLINILLFEIKNPNVKNTLYGLDYLKLGLIHYSTFNQLAYLLSATELNSIKLNTLQAISKTYNLFLVFEHKTTEELIEDFTKIYNYYIECIKNLPILGYLLFEVLSEYIALYQSGEAVEYYKQYNELYCGNFKNLIYEVSPHLTKSFNLGSFSPSLGAVKKYLSKINLLGDSHGMGFESYLLNRIKYLIRSRFYNVESNYYFEGLPKVFAGDYDKITLSLTPLVGHTIHRLLRNMHRYPNFYYYFDQYKALQAWNHWNQTEIPIIYNALLPKGETGINAAYPDLEYKVYTVTIQLKDRMLFVEKKTEVDYRLQPRLGEVELLLMRKR